MARAKSGATNRPGVSMWTRSKARLRQQLYDEREKRVRDAIALRQPDRVPVDLRMTYFPARYTGIPISTAYYDAAAWKDAVIKTIVDYEPDLWMCASGNSPGAAMEALGPTQTKWPGGPLPPNVSHQAIDVEVMREDEYELFLSDPGDYTVRYLLPRAYEALAPLASLPSLSDRLVGFGAMTPMFTRQEFRKLARALLKAGQETEKWQAGFGQSGRRDGGPRFSSPWPHGRRGWGPVRCSVRLLPGDAGRDAGHVPPSGRTHRHVRQATAMANQPGSSGRPEEARQSEAAVPGPAPGRRRFHVKETIREILLAGPEEGDDDFDRVGLRADAVLRRRLRGPAGVFPRTAQR